jgi:hypothetical protein
VYTASQAVELKNHYLLLITRFILSFWLTLFFLYSYGQNPNAKESKKNLDSARMHQYRLRLFTGPDQIDVFDIIHYLFSEKKEVRKDTSKIKTGKAYFSVLPSLEYTLQTGFAGAINGNLAFYTSNHDLANISSIYAVAKYTQKKQFLLPVQANIWSKGNRYNVQTDWHFEKFPQQTYGLGSLTTDADGYQIDYDYFRFYQTLYKTIFTDFYLGVGYDFDYYFNISEVNPPPGDSTDFRKYGFSSKEASSGLTLSLLYDERRNLINPQQGYFANIIFRTNYRFLGSDSSWQAIVLDLRKYQNFPASSKNIIAFWTYDWFTIAGKPPYLNLPATASDTYNNFGRGYIQGRFRGRDLLYFETEYRFGITQNGFVGGVVFANAQSFTEETTHRFEAILPGWGAGIRIKLNKFSKTNLAIDYGFGLHGSHGIFANLGEVF